MKRELTYATVCSWIECMSAALANGDKAQAVEELYDVIAVLLRTVYALEGRQKLGRPKVGANNDAWK